MRLVIGGPTRELVAAAFTLDLLQLYDDTHARGPWSSVTVGLIESTYVHVGREQFLEQAIQQCHATHVLWLDTDMRFPADTAIRLAQHGQPIVACNCLMRDPRRLWTAKRDGKRIETTQRTTGLEVVDTVGLAVMLMATGVVATMPRPWFRHGWNPAAQSDVGEDHMFCHALREAGHAIYIDHDLSKEIGHIGQHTYGLHREAPVAV